MNCYVRKSDSLSLAVSEHQFDLWLEFVEAIFFSFSLIERDNEPDPKRNQFRVEHAVKKFFRREERAI